MTWAILHQSERLFIHVQNLRKFLLAWVNCVQKFQAQASHQFPPCLAKSFLTFDMYLVGIPFN